ncbi:MAG: tetratricopeptide repeat protein, partial [Planctomycetes bacterium]|nr:tetratricopeptide repeat protein [Planctomycetota bacterium]
MSDAKQSAPVQEAPTAKPWVAPRWLLPAFAAAVVFLGCVAYWPQLDNGFTNWDDNWLITENRWIRSLDLNHVTTIFNPMAPQEIREELGNEYLPLRDLSYSVNYALDGYNPRGYQATNLLLHIFNSLLVLLLAARLTGKPLLGGLAGLLFAIHPVHVEAVSWLSSRKDLLATFFVLLSLNFYLAARVPRSGLMASASFVQRARESKRLAWTLALLCFICALLSKMHAVVLPALLLLIELYRGRALALASLAKRALMLAPFWFVAALFTALAMKIGQGLMREPYGDSLIATWLTATAALTRDIQVLVTGWPLQACVDFELRTGITPYVAAGGTLLVLTLGAGAAGLWFSWRDYSRRSSFLLAMLGFGALWFLIALSPVSNFFVQIGTVYADRYLYLPSVGFCVAVAAVTSAAWERSQLAGNAALGSLARVALVVAIGAGSIAGIWQTSRTTQNWRDSETLWISVLKLDEQNHTAHFNLGREYQERAMVETSAKNREHLLQLAEMEYRNALTYKALTYRHDPARVYGALASIEIYRGAPAEALKLLDDAALHIDQPWRPARGKADIEAILGNYRGLALSALGRHEEALAEFRKALAKSNRYAGYRINLASEIARDALKDFPADGSPVAGAKINEAALEQAFEELRHYERDRGRDSNSVEALALILKKEFDARLAMSGKGGESTLPEGLKPLLKKAQDAYKEAIALREKEVRNSKAMATLLLQAAEAFLPGSPGDKTAELFLKRALSLDQEREGVRYLLARLLSERDDQASRIEATRMLNEELEKHPDFKPARSMRASGLLQQAVNELAALYSRFLGEFKSKRPDEGNPTWTQLTRDFVNREQYRVALDRGVALFVEAARWDSENKQLGEILNGGEPALALDVGRGLWFFGSDSGRAQAELLMRTAFNLLPQDGPLTRFLTGIYLELAEKAVRTSDRAELLKLIENMLQLSKTARKLMSVQLINLATDIDKGNITNNAKEEKHDWSVVDEKELSRLAAELMRTALLLDPESIPALNWLKLYYEKEGELEEAIVIYGKFEELLSGKPEMLSGVRMAMAQCQFDLGQRCVKDYQKYLKLHDSDRAGRFAARAIEVLMD